MRAWDILGYALGATRGRRLRTVLTTLGVIIGIAAIVSLLSLSQGLQSTVAYQLQAGLATDTLIVTPLDQGTRSLLMNDSQAIEAIDQVSLAVPLLQRAGALSANGTVIEVSVVGVDFAKYRAIYGQAFVSQQGTIPTGPSEDAVVLGASIYDPSQNGSVLAAPGDQVQLSRLDVTSVSPAEVRHNGTVVGVLKEIGALSTGGLSDSSIYIPITKAAAFYQTSGATLILVKLHDDRQATIDAATAAIKELFKDQVRVTSPKSVQNLVAGVFSTLDMFLLGIAGISLMVAGVGIMNVMMVSLLERRREIGILKALGMRDRTVLAIFLCEAAVIGLIGGVFGVMVGIASADLVAFVLGKIALPVQLGSWAAEGIAITPIMSSTVLIGAIAFGLAISLIFALYPAWRSSRMLPVIALRNE
jgi:putative ABC transport system permease protein